MEFEQSNILVEIIFIIFFGFVGINLLFRNESSTKWFEEVVKKYSIHGNMTGHTYNRGMFYFMGVISLLMSIAVIILVIASYIFK